MSVKVTICGPNLNDQSKGTFHVHTADCADLVKHARREPEYRSGWTVEADSVEEVVTDVYGDMMDESESPWTDYADDLYFFPCCKAAGLA